MSKPLERMIELFGTPDEITAMLNVASRVEPRIFKKRRVDAGHYILWYRAKEPPNDLVMAIRKRAGLLKPRIKPIAYQADGEEGDDNALSDS